MHCCDHPFLKQLTLQIDPMLLLLTTRTTTLRFPIIAILLVLSHYQLLDPYLSLVHQLAQFLCLKFAPFSTSNRYHQCFNQPPSISILPLWSLYDGHIALANYILTYFTVFHSFDGRQLALDCKWSFTIRITNKVIEN